jgi:hypothetical protein
MRCATPSDDKAAEACHEEATVQGLKMVAVAAILVPGAGSIAIPLLDRCWRGRDGATAAEAAGTTFTGGSGGSVSVTVYLTMLVKKRTKDVTEADHKSLRTKLAFSKDQGRT